MKKANNIKIFILSILTTIIIYSERFLKELVITYNKLETVNIKSLIKNSYSNTDFLLIFILTIALIIFYKKFQTIKKQKSYNILSLIFSLLLVFGFSYSIVGDSSLVISHFILIIINIIKIIVYYKFISTILNIFVIKLKTFNLNNIKLSNKITKFKNYYEDHPFKTTLIIILLAWLPYIISFYPAILSPDPANQIKQYFNMETHYIEGVNLIDENILITNHHPVFHTFILGGFTKIGDLLGSVNIGLFMFTCFQLFIVISAIIYTLLYLKKIKVPFVYRFIILLLFAFVPVFPLYALSSVKDTMFGALLIFFIIEIHKLLTNKEYKVKDYIILALLLLIMMLVRNNGIYIILFSMITLLIIVKEKRLAILFVIIGSLVSYETHNKILLPSMHITPGSIREMLSVPFQQTARHTKYYGKEYTKEEKKVIDKILGFKTLGNRYVPRIADPVKNEFNKDTTNEDLMEYFKIWFKYLLKHPGVYIDATVNTVYGYFYPNTSYWYVYYNYDQRLKESNMDYHYNNLKISRNILSSYAVIYPYIPILGSQVNIGFNVWTYMFLVVFLIAEKKKKYIVLLMPALTLLLTCVVGPVNTYFRYMFPLVISLPLILGIIYQDIIIKNKKSK